MEKNRTYTQQEIDIMVGRLTQLYSDVKFSLKPSGSDTSTNIFAFTQDKGIYVATDNGNWYFWNGTRYQSGGAFQSREIGDGSITSTKIADGAVSKQKLDTRLLQQLTRMDSQLGDNRAHTANNRQLINFNGDRLNILETQINAGKNAIEYTSDKQFDITCGGANIIDSNAKFTRINGKTGALNGNLFHAKANIKSTGRNLFDKTKVTQGVVLSHDGGTYSDANMFTSDFIRVIPNKQYTRNYFNGWARGYDINKKYVADVSGLGVGNIPSNCYYIRFSSAKENIEKCYISFDTTINAYEPYILNTSLIDTELGQYDYIDVLSRQIVRHTSEVLTIKPENIVIVGGSPNQNGEYVAYTNIRATDKFSQWNTAIGVTNSHYVVKDVTEAYVSNNSIGISSGTNDFCLSVGTQSVSLEQVKALCPIQLVYKKATPTTSIYTNVNGFVAYKNGLTIQDTLTLPYEYTAKFVNGGTN